ncbi:DUF262 domain-containing protein [Spirulina sp. CS-785/01]|uniref:DUF262 domain-containing protein n=1 Tax=Spirulina sp. CS-785/01 TaxID=3021716 RepID=UPI002331318A|nr:DUF262 domain-containing protein [Spirulina sp. CS-785/01]MDB9311933.1 DUF262 domain-containing protein [Spirulina sp. CS-785/01]
MGLQQEIDKMRQEIRADSYSMSIGEWSSLYDDNEIDIHPEFQRFFRWSSFQKTGLIESILLGIPIPPIFVAQREDGIWDVVDGVQRLSTIYEFMGKLKNENNEKVEPLVLEETKYLPNLEGKKWHDPEDEENSLSQSQRLLIKRAKIDVTILLKESDEIAKYELFQRLNTRGSIATQQEVRSCILVMLNKEMFNWMRKMSHNEEFQECVSLSDRPLQEQYDMELLLRFLIFRTIQPGELKKIRNDLGSFITDKMIDMAQNKKFNYSIEEFAFKTTFKVLYENMGSDSFRRYSKTKQQFMGGFLVSAYEVIALGIGYHYKSIEDSHINIRDKIKELWSNENYQKWSGSGTTAQRRIPKLVPLGRTMFKP